ncbi:MAG: BrnA antitoxin family protein [Rhodoferax sp.]|nr:BrnA antitoxin family protein [Rhodoferax sp.]
MQKYLTLRDGRKILLNTPEEDAQITAAAMSDPDAQPLTDEEWALVLPTVRRGRPPSEVKRPMVSMRLDPDLVAHLRASGKGWQTKLNAAVRTLVEQGRL